MKPTKIAVIADVHAHPHAQFSGIDENGLNSRFVEIVLALQRSMDDALNRGATHLVIAGDLFQHGQRMLTQYWNEVHGLVRRYAPAFEQFVILAGNHDQIVPGATESILRGLASEHCDVIEEATLDLWGGVKVVLVPYTTDSEALTRWLSDQQKEDRPGLMIGHLAVSGALAGRFEYQPAAAIDPKALEALVDGPIILGHYHRQQEVGERTYYVGSLTSLDFGDAGQTKGYMLVGIAPSGQIEVQRVPLDSTGFLVLRHEEERPMEIPENCSAKGRIVKVEYTGVVDEAYIRQQLESLGAKHVVFDCQRVAHADARVKASDGQDSEPSQLDYLRAYVEQNGEGFDPVRLLEVGQKLTKGASV